MRAKNDRLLTPLEAAHHLGITTELLFQFTKRNFGKTRGLRSLQTVEHDGQTHFSLIELNAFDSMLASQWCGYTASRPRIPKAILDHLRAESQNQCARCGSGVGVDTAHIRSWAISRSHHPQNLIRICSVCHREHDAQHSLSTEQLQAIKDRLTARTRASLMDRMQPSGGHLRSPRSLQGFVGREKELQVLVEALRSGRSATIYGVAGIGKSELLLQALSRCDTGRPALWCNIEQYRTVTDVVSALRIALATDGTACSEEDLPSRLDAAHLCVVFDGIEQASLDDLDSFEDTVNALFHATSDTQFISTSQILLHRLPAEMRLNLVGLGESASRALLKQSCAGSSTIIHGDVDELLKFCDGHALTIKIAGALTEHYGSATAALEAIHRCGIQSISLPGRRHHTRQTSLESCLQTAYEALADSGRQLLCALSQAPAGVWTHYIEREWLELDDIAEALASLRKWHLVDVVLVYNQLSRTQVLAPVRRFVVERVREADPKSFEKIIRQVVQGFAMMVAVLELKYDTPEDTPYVLQRFGDELPNFLHVLELSEERQEDEQLVTTALSIVQSLMRYFFVLRLPEQGASVMFDATDLAFRAGRLEKASGLAKQFLSLAQRAQDEAMFTKGLGLVKKIASISENPEVLADVATCQAMAAQGTNDFAKAEQYALHAFKGYRTSLLSLKGKTDEDGSLEFKRNDLHNNLSNALSMLGLSLLSQQKYKEAAKAYRHSLQHERGAAVGVNRGQTLHQIGNCEAYQGNYKSASELYLEAVKIFHLVGMKEYLSNAFGELGYTLLDVDQLEIINLLSDELVDSALLDLSADIQRVFNLGRPLDHQQCVGMIRKLFGAIILISLTRYAGKLKEFCVNLADVTVVELAKQVDTGMRDRGEVFPITTVNLVLHIGVLIAQGEFDLEGKGDITHETTGDLLRTVCEAHGWAHDVMRLTDWLSVYFTQRWEFKGVGAARLREFVVNYRDDIEDHLELVR